MSIESRQVEILGTETNAAVIRVPGRRYPGVLIQGDSLHNILCLVQEVDGLLLSGDVSSAKDTVCELGELLRAFLQVYERALADAGEPTPYSRP